MAGRHVEPERADSDIAFRLTWTDQQLAQLDAQATRQLKAHRVARRIGVVRLRASGEWMNDLILAEVRLREAGTDPERLAARGIGNVAATAEIDVPFSYSFD